MLVLVEAFRLIATRGRDRVADITGESEVPRRGGAVGSMLDNELAELVSKLPADQLGM